MAVPWHVNLRAMFLRRTSTAMTIVGVGLVVMVFVLVASLANGLTEVFRSTGDPRNVLVLRAASRSELESGISRTDWAVLRTMPEVDRLEDGEPMASAEAFLVINQPRRGAPEESANVIVRGVGPVSFVLRPEVRLVEGRMFRPGVAELIASRAMAQRFDGLGLGEEVVLRGRPFRVVGIFDAARTAWDSEVWGDVEVLSATFNRRRGFSSVLLRSSGAGARARLVRKIETDRRFNYRAPSQVDYFEAQTDSAATLKILTWILTIVLSVGACFSAANTMYAAVAHRAREIGTLRALGFTRRAILSAFVLESLALSLIAGAVGVAAAGAVLQAATGYAGTSNFRTFSEVAFSFRLSPSIATAGLAIAGVTGVIGGFLPARLAARMPIISSLRQT